MAADLAALKEAASRVLDVCEDAGAVAEALRVLAGSIGSPPGKPRAVGNAPGDWQAQPRTAAYPFRANNFQPSVRMSETAHAALTEAVATYGKSKTARLIGVTRSIVAAASKRGTASVTSVETIETWAKTFRSAPNAVDLVSAVKEASERAFGVVDEDLIAQKSGAGHASVVALLSGFAIGAADAETLRAWSAA